MSVLRRRQFLPGSMTRSCISSTSSCLPYGRAVQPNVWLADLTIQLILYWSLDIPRRLLIKLVLAAMLVLSIGSEALQAALPNGRTFDPVDIGANLLGSVLALGLCSWYHKRMLERKRRRKLQGYGHVVGGDGEDVELGEGGSGGQELEVLTGDEGSDDGGEAWDDMDGGDDAGQNGKIGEQGQDLATNR